MVMPELPYGLGCPICPYYVEVSEEDPDASLSELYTHIWGKHTAYDRAAVNALLAKAVELTEAEAAER
jgi:hypothetical protein